MEPSFVHRVIGPQKRIAVKRLFRRRSFRNVLHPAQQIAGLLHNSWRRSTHKIPKYHALILTRKSTLCYVADMQRMAGDFMLYQDLVESYSKEPRDVHTIPLNREPIWFFTYVEKGFVYVRTSCIHGRSSRIKAPRKLNPAECKTMFEIYVRRKNGERVSDDAKDLCFLSAIDHRDHHLTTTHTKAREASSEKASRAFYMVFNFVHNRRKTALHRRLALCVWELRPERPQVRILSAAPNQYNPNQFFPVGDGFGLFVYFERYENTYFPNGVIKRPESKPRGARKRK